MAAFAIMIRDRMRNEDLFKEYGALARLARPETGMSPLAFYGAAQTLEGPDADGVVILRFETMDAAKAWYDSEAYKKARAVRNQAADYRVILVEGV